MFKIFKNIYTHIKYTRILNKALKEEHIIEGLSELLGANIKKDWIGHYYVVVNPNIRNGQYNPDAALQAIGEDGNDTFVWNWVMERMVAAQEFIRVNNLFDLVTYNIERIDDNGNYLFIFQPITLDDAFKSIKNLVIGSFISIPIIILIWLCVHLNFISL